jgi:hypothetical protein
MLLRTMARSVGRRGLPALAAAWIGLVAVPARAQAHAGPVMPVASNYIATVRHAPRGVDAKVVDGSLELWLDVPPRMTVVVLDYRGAPYLRFSSAGVQINTRSSMYQLNLYYLHEGPMPSAKLNRSTPPDWQPASDVHDYMWHDGRLQALTSIAVGPGTSYVGRWTIPLLVDGHRAALSGTVRYASRPTLVWYWPIVVLLACVLAGWRLHRPQLDAAIVRGLATLALLAIAIIAVGQELRGRPIVSSVQPLELALYLVFVAWGAHRVLVQRPGYFSLFVIAFATLWEGIDTLPTLQHGFVLLALPAFPARAATVLCLATAPGLLVYASRLARSPAGQQSSNAPSRRLSTASSGARHQHAE